MAVRSSPPAQGLLFDAALPLPAHPEGLALREDFISEAEESALIANFGQLSFAPFAFQGWFGKRETVSFGWRYDFSEARVHAAPPIPEFLLPLRARAAAFAGLSPAALEQALVIRYEPGAGIGWHRDRPVFDEVVGISLAAPCVMRFRRREGARFRRHPVTLPARSAYLLTGEIRHQWEHSIAPMAALRFSVTFRSRAQAT